MIDFVELGGLYLGSDERPWAQSLIDSEDGVQAAYAITSTLAEKTVPHVIGLLEKAAKDAGLASPDSITGWRQYLDLWTAIAETHTFFSTDVFAIDLAEAREVMQAARAGFLPRVFTKLTSGSYRRTRKRLIELCLGSKASDRDLLLHVQLAYEQLQQWVSSSSNLPSVPSNLIELIDGYETLCAALGELGKYDSIDLLERKLADVCARLDALLDDRATLVALPELQRLKASFESVGLADLIDELREHRGSAAECADTFRVGWLKSILEHISISDRLVGGFVPEKHERLVDEFRTGDSKHIVTSAARIRRIWAERVREARDEFRDQRQIVDHQVNLKRRHMPIREFVRTAADILLAIKPCWAMSPLGVSQILPAKSYFDVVIFDEASQVTPADAVTSILRGKQLVIAGDQQQLPPSAFFVSETPDEDDEDGIETTSVVGGTRGFESILDALSALIPFRALEWHYRSRDERLIAFSNAHIYDHSLTTFPGVSGDECLRHVEVPWDASAETNSPHPEVNAVVDLILDHAKLRPDESLGVIAMGIKHANRIQEALRQRLHDNPTLRANTAEFFDEDQEEAFFVKNLERVQGDERDAMILSIGYGKNHRGELVYRFGPLLTEGGERRLNVAVTRAKRRLTLVSSFSSRDMDDERSQAQGVRLLRQYLQYVESGGVNLGDRAMDKPPLNAFEIDVKESLTKAGLHLTPQYGVSGYWIDFVVRHPDQGGYVLALECDGASYHSSESARDRDRLRQEHLERLGWTFHRIWSTEWFQSKQRAMEKVMQAYRDAILFPGNPEQPALSTPVLGDPDEGSLLQQRSSVRPRLPRGRSIAEYSGSQLVQLIKWIDSDGILRTEDELITEVMAELGFQRRGSQIVRVIQDAIRRVKS